MSWIFIPAYPAIALHFHGRYEGLLMSSHYTQVRTQYICMDKDVELSGSTANNDGALVYPVETEVGGHWGHASNGYVHNREVGCSVCTYAG